MHLWDVESAKGLLNKGKELQALLLAENTQIYSPRIMIQALPLKGNFLRTSNAVLKVLKFITFQHG